MKSLLVFVLSLFISSSVFAGASEIVQEGENADYTIGQLAVGNEEMKTINIESDRGVLKVSVISGRLTSEEDGVSDSVALCYTIAEMNAEEPHIKKCTVLVPTQD